MGPLTTVLKKIPLVSGVARFLYRRLNPDCGGSLPFKGSADYWEQRYARGGNSGVGSYNKFAQFKADIVNGFIKDHQIETVIEFGCGDGNQLKLADYPHYQGFDVSESVISLCRQQFVADRTKDFRLMKEYTEERADLVLSLDVIFHLVEDAVFNEHMEGMFRASTKYVIAYSSNSEANSRYDGPHVRHRQFTTWITAHAPGWRLLRIIPNRYPYRGDYMEGSFADFYVFERTT